MLIRREAEALMALADRFDMVQQEDMDAEDEQPSTRQSTSFEQTLSILNNLPPGGKVIITGIGKSGLLGRKAAATFCSLG